MTPTIPRELITALTPVGTKRLVTLPPRAKKYPPKGWAEPENQLTPDDPKLIAHLERGGNYGVVGGRGLVLMDTDAPETEAIAQTLPRTFTIQSGGEGNRYHRYYQTDLIKTIPLKKAPASGEKKQGYGELRASRSYVVGPGSIHETTGNEYTVADPQPLAFISEAQLREAFKEYIEPDTAPTTPTPRQGSAALDGLKIVDVLATYGISLKRTGGELRGKNPTHGDNPSSFSVNPDKNVWRCHPCQTGGGPVELIAIMEGIITCEQCKPGALRGEDFKKTLDAARKKGLVEDAKTTFNKVADSIPETQAPEAVKPEAVNPAKYFVFEKGKQPVFLPDIMTKDITAAYKIATFTDTEQSFRYHPEDGTYVEDAIPTVKAFMLAALKKYFKKSYSEEAIYQLQIKTYVNRAAVEPPPELFNMKNGILNIKTRELLPHTPAWFFLSCSPTTHDPDAEAPEYKKLLEFIKCPKEKTLQEFAGSLLLSSSKYKKAGFIYGPTDGAKTTWTNAVLNVIGPDAVSSIAIQNLDHRFQAQRLYGKKVNMCGDLGNEAFSSIAMFKRTTGGDIIESEIKGKNRPLSFNWTGKHLFDANDLPKAEGEADTDAFYNRLLMFPFSRTVPKDQINRDLPARLAAEASGILNWMLEGLDRLETNKGFTDQTDIEEIKTQYKRAADSVYCFVTDRCELLQGEYTAKLESHRLYVAYCIEQGFSPKGRSQFYELLQTNLPGIMTDRKKIGNEKPQVWMNLIITDAIPRPTAADLTSYTNNTTIPAYTPPATPNETSGNAIDRSTAIVEKIIENGEAPPRGDYAGKVVSLVSLVQSEHEDAKITHLKRVAQKHLAKIGYETKKDFFNFMNAAGHPDQKTILDILGLDKKFEVTEGGIRLVEEDE